VEHTQLRDAVRAPSPTFSKRELYAHYEDVTNAVIKQYVHIKSLSPVVAQSIDPHPLLQSQKLSFDLVGYGVDIELATEQVLQDHLDLQAAWFSMALNESVSPALRKDVLWKCGRIYNARNLAPWRYWRRGSKYGVTTR
jgi:hypothetical protein